ncbi:hypothetical protein SO694_00030016 [Aureococcus anophagefferens]|uniref:Uncharacterized protein n=1 Tax=Aureococcus anophagefferens TaxID=44056 RepID=A0ABR1FJS7_AURAN
MVFLGEFYEHGRGVKLDKKKAARLFRMAADRGDADAQFNVGFLLYSEKKHEEAFRYYTLAANQGYTNGEFNLGICYKRGEGTEVDLVKARYWFERAAAKGHEDAIKALAAELEIDHLKEEIKKLESKISTHKTEIKRRDDTIGHAPV